MCQAQIAADTIYHAIYSPGGVEEAKDSIYNSTTDSLTVTWSVPTSNVNMQTGFTNLQICDECYCYPTNLLPQNHTCKKYLPNKWGIMKALVTTDGTPGVGNSYITLTSNLGSITYVYITWPTNVKSVSEDIRFSVYPNPTVGNIQVAFNIKNLTSVNVLNVIGRKVAKYDVSRNAVSPISLPTDNLPTGVYLLQFVDANGKVVGVKRITKQ